MEPRASARRDVVVVALEASGDREGSAGGSGLLRDSAADEWTRLVLEAFDWQLVTDEASV